MSATNPVIDGGLSLCIAVEQRGCFRLCTGVWRRRGVRGVEAQQATVVRLFRFASTNRRVALGSKRHWEFDDTCTVQYRGKYYPWMLSGPALNVCKILL